MIMTTKRCCEASKDVWIKAINMEEELDNLDQLGRCKAGMLFIECKCCKKIIPVLLTSNDGHFGLSKWQWNKLFNVCNKSIKKWVEE